MPSNDHSTSPVKRKLPLEKPLGPDSLVWRYGGDLRFMLVVGYVAIIEEMHPGFSALSMQNSLFFADVWRRWFERTIPRLNMSIFAGEKAVAEAMKTRDFHKGLKGVHTDGRVYHAMDPSIFHWAHATQFYAMMRMIELYVNPDITEQEKEQFYQETRQLWRQYGMTERVCPPDWKSFLIWYDEFAAEHCVATPGVTTMMEFLAGAPPPPLPGWMGEWWSRNTRDWYEDYVWLSCSLLTPLLRERLGLPPWSQADEERLRKFIAEVRRRTRWVPDTVLMHPVARAAHWRENKSIASRVSYVVGEAAQRPIAQLWHYISAAYPLDAQKARTLEHAPPQ